jgi:Domain of unknown function (DUF4149)
MLCFCKTLHVLSVGLWFGTVAFFTVAALLIFQAFEDLSDKPESDRPWFPVPAMFQHDPSPEGFPRPLRREQGSRAAGVAVTRIFPAYYGLQLGSGVIALLSALYLAQKGEGRGHRWRVALCVLALATVGLGWWLENTVTELRKPRNELTDAVLTASTPSQEQMNQALAARAEFFRWHSYSLMQNFATLILVTVVTGLAAHLPDRKP